MTQNRPRITRAQFIKLCERVRAGESKTAIARDLGISRDSVYRLLKRGESFYQSLRRKEAD